MIKKIAIIYDESFQWTTGHYCKRALEKLGYTVNHFESDNIDTISNQFDLYLNIDDNKRYLFPRHLKPSAYWVIDTHTEYDWRLKKAKMFDFVFAADKRGSEWLKRDDVWNVYWLPLACDPDIHKVYHLPREYDLTFIGHYHHLKDRIQYLNFLKNKLKANKLFIGQAYGEDMPKIYSKSKIIFNKAIDDYATMRMFEAMACQGLLVTNDMSKNGQTELFGSNPPFVVYYSKRDLIKKIRFYLRNDNLREEIARKGYEEVSKKHTYVHRMQELIKIIEKRKEKLKYEYGDEIQDLGIFGDVYPELIRTIGDEKKVLDIGCSSGNVSKFLVSKNNCFVTGIEKNPLLAEKAKRVLSEVIVGDATDEQTYSKINNKYDFILLMDILEHVVNPEFILWKVKNFLKEDGKIFIATPNIAYWAIRKDLLLGRFNYDARGGDLDNEHVHLFTYYSLKDLIRNCGYSIKSLDMLYSLPFFNANHNFFKVFGKTRLLKKFSDIVASWFPNFLASKLFVFIEKRQQTTIFSDTMNGIIRREVKAGNYIKYDDYSGDISVMDNMYGKVFAFINGRKNVLDIGCATGRFSKYLVWKKKCFVTGVEKNGMLAEKAKSALPEVILGDAVNPETYEKISLKYDYALLMDILEHTTNPEYILLKVKNFLTETGQVILTTPNITYWAIRKELLLGKFNYNLACNIMDNEHVHFFSYYSIKDLIQDCRYRIRHFDMLYSFPVINSNNYFFKKIIKRKLVKKVLDNIARRYPNLFACQFLFVIEKRI